MLLGDVSPGQDSKCHEASSGEERIGFKCLYITDLQTPKISVSPHNERNAETKTTPAMKGNSNRCEPSEARKSVD